MNLWIQVKDKMPPNNTPVLTNGKSYDSEYNGGCVIARYMGDWIEPMWITGKQEERVHDVTLWQELPDVFGPAKSFLFEGMYK